MTDGFSGETNRTGDLSQIRAIFSNEIRQLVLSPISWVAIAFFVAYLGYNYIAAFESAIRMDFADSGASRAHVVLTGSQGLHARVLDIIFLLIPLITMGVLSREYSSGSVKLLLSSPVNIHSIIIGKFLALSSFVILMMSVIFGLIVLASLLIINVDVPHALSGLLGVGLLSMAYMSIGLFMSSISKNQFVAVIATITLLGILDFIGFIGQRIPVVDEIAHWLSISGRAYDFINGLVRTDDVTYFVLLTICFTSLAYFRMFSQVTHVKPIKLYASYIGACLAAISVGLISSNYHLSTDIDVTRFKNNLPAEGVREILWEEDRGIIAYVYVNAIEPRASSLIPAYQKRTSERLFGMFERLVGPVTVEYHFYYPDLEETTIVDAREFARQNRLDFDRFIRSSELPEYLNIESEQFNHLIALETVGSKAVLRTYPDMQFFPLESAIAAGIVVLDQGKVTLYYDEERTGSRPATRNSSGSADYYAMTTERDRRHALVNHGFQFVSATICETPAEPDGVIMVAPGALSLSSEERQCLAEYFGAGGSGLIALDELSAGTTIDWIPGVGISLGERAQTKEGSDGLQFGRLTSAAMELGISAPEVYRGKGVFLVSNPVRIDRVVSTDFQVTDLINLDPAAFEPEDTLSEDENVRRVAVALEREVNGRKQRIIVIGDSDFMSSASADRRRPNARLNLPIHHRFFNFVSGGSLPVNVGRPLAIDNRTRLDLTDLDYLRLALLLIIPFGILGTFGLVYFRRKRA